MSQASPLSEGVVGGGVGVPCCIMLEISFHVDITFSIQTTLADFP
jgi:hypothetical protein